MTDDILCGQRGKGDVFAWSVWVWTDCLGSGDCSDEVSIGGMFQFSVDQHSTRDAMPPVDYHRGASSQAIKIIYDRTVYFTSDQDNLRRSHFRF